MSYMGSIGYVMAGSGLDVLLETVYAPNTVVHMLSGHAYAEWNSGIILRTEYIRSFQSPVRFARRNSKISLAWWR